MNETYYELVLSRVRAAVDAAQSVQTIGHDGLKGRLREIVIRDLLRPTLPADIGLGTGEIVTAVNKKSSEQDVVMYDKRILPPIVMEGASGIFPIESVLYTIEVKSKLTATELEAAHKNAARLAALEYRPGIHTENGIPLSHDYKKLVSCIFAFYSDLTGTRKSEVERYNEDRGEKPPAITVLCVVGKGYWIWKWNENRWHQPLVFDDAFGEVIGFIAGVMNTYRILSASRWDPRLGMYLLPGQGEVRSRKDNHIVRP